MNGLVLTGGGARAAYQVGVLKALSEILDLPSGFPIITGVSAGAINGSFLAARDEGFKIAVQGLWDLWAHLEPASIFTTNSVKIARMMSRWMLDLTVGGFKKGNCINYLLDTEPLRELVAREINFKKIRSNVAKGAVYGVAVSATNYISGTAVTFFDGHPDIKSWERSMRISFRTHLQPEHVVASSSIPIFFQPEKVEGSFYGDGGVRLSTPLSPAIHMGADRILAIGIRKRRTTQQAVHLSRQAATAEPEVADIAGVLLNALFMDSLETDLERMMRVNRTLEILQENGAKGHSELRPIPIYAIMPSKDLGELASELFNEFPFTVRHLLRGIGASDERGWDLVSYLAFDKAFTVPLLELGYADVYAQKEEVRAFFAA